MLGVIIPGPAAGGEPISVTPDPLGNLPAGRRPLPFQDAGFRTTFTPMANPDDGARAAELIPCRTRHLDCIPIAGSLSA